MSLLVAAISFLLLLSSSSTTPSIASREGVMLVRDDPASALLAQPDGQTKAVVGILPQLLFRPATEQGGREGDIVARGDVERDDLERGPTLLPFEERGP